MTALRARGLSYSYGNRPILCDVDIEVEPGEVVGLLGPNGAGKTTLFRLLSGELSCTGCEITIDGAPVSGSPLWKRTRLGLGYIPQSPSVLLDFTVQENLMFGLLAVSKTERAARYHKVVDQFALTELQQAKGGTLSGGERRRVELARTLASAPSVILADEPFAALDPIASQGVAQMLRAVAKSGVGVLITDHDVQQSLSICDRVYILHAGEIITSGKPESVIENEQVRTIYFGTLFGHSQK